MALMKLDFKPGVNKEDTPYTAEGGWVESDKIRFRSGRPEKMGGWEKYQNTTVVGVARRLHPFRDLSGTNYVAIGTTEKVYVETGGTFIDITPIRATLTTSDTDNCVITTGASSTVRINVNSHGCEDGAWVTISGVEGDDGVDTVTEAGTSAGGVQTATVAGNASGAVQTVTPAGISVGGVSTATAAGTSLGGVSTVTEAGTSTGTATFTAVTQTATSGSGTGADFTISTDGAGNYTVDAVTTAGSGYAVGDTITIDGTNLGGATPANDLTLTITATAASFSAVAQTATSGAGTGATFNISEASGTYSLTSVATAGSGYAVGDTITIAGTSLGGATPANDLTLTVTATGATFTGIAQTSTSGAGTGATFDISEASGTYTVTAVATSGTGYAVNDTITIAGTSLGGATPANDLTLTVTVASTAAASSTGVAQTSTSGNGTGATFDISVVSGAYTVTAVAAAGSGYEIGDTISIAGTSVGGTSPANDLTLTVTALVAATFTAVAQTSTSGSGTGATFDVTASGGTYTVTAVVAAGAVYAVSDTITIAGTSLGGATPDNDLTLTVATVVEVIDNIPVSEINAEHKISYVDTSNFDITVTTAATSGVSGDGGTAIDIECQINPGPVNGLFQYGFGSGTWGAGTWGTPRSSSIPLDPRIWNFANWGEDLIFNYQGGPVYIWDASSATSRGVQITEAPYKVDHILVTRDRHLVCFGCNPPGTANEFQPKEDLLIRWCDQEDYTEWTVTSTNTAGDQLLTNGTRIVGAADVESQVIVWTDSDVQSMQFLGPPYTFGFNQIGTNAGMISSRAWAAYNNVVYWMGDSAFYVFQGGTNVLPCTMQKYVFDGLDLTQRRKTFCSINRRNHEVTWYYPAVSQNPRYLNGAISATDTTIQLETTAGLPVSGSVQIGAEIISFTSKNDTKLLGCTRGTSNTTAAAHADGASVTSTSWTLEPYHYVTYSVIDKIWWEGKLERTAMIDAGNLSNPIGVDYNGQLYYHEAGYDADGAPLVAYIQSGDFDIAEGDSLMHIHRVIPDFTVDGSVDLAMQTKYYPLDSETREFIGTVTSTTQKINTRIRARNMALRIKSKDSGDWWKYGSTRVDQRTDGRR